MTDAELGGAFRFEVGQMPEIIVKALSRSAVEAGPESRFAERDTAALGHALIVIRDPRDHVDVRIDVIHTRWLQSQVAADQRGTGRCHAGSYSSEKIC